MAVKRKPPHRTVILILAAAIILWGLFAVVDMKNVPFAGFEGAEQVLRVDEGGPADRAGMQVGDRILSHNGIPSEEIDGFYRRSRPEVGESWTYVVERTDPASREAMTERVVVTFTSEPAATMAGDFGGMAIGLVTLFCGILAYFKAPSKTSLLFCIACLAVGHQYFLMPYSSNRRIMGSLRVIDFVFGLAMVAVPLHFLMVFPKRKKLLEPGRREKWIYLPAALLALLVLVGWFFDAEHESTWAVLGPSMFILAMTYPVLILVALVHTFVSAKRGEWRRFRLGYVLLGLILGAGPVVFATALGVFAPEVTLPGSGFYDVAFVLIPVAFGFALIRSGKMPPAGGPSRSPAFA